MKFIPLVFAGWLRYLMGVDDQGNPFTLSPDTMLDTPRPFIFGIKLGDTVDDALPKPIPENSNIFGVNFYEVGLAPLVCRYFREMTTGCGAVRATLEKYV